MKQLKTEITSDEKTCLDCRWFSRHYIKEKTGYKKIYCGNCLHAGIKHWHKSRLFKACGFWESKLENNETDE